MDLLKPPLATHDCPSNNLTIFNIKQNFSKNLFFSSAVIEWNNLDYLFELLKVFAYLKKHLAIYKALS